MLKVIQNKGVQSRIVDAKANETGLGTPLGKYVDMLKDRSSRLTSLKDCLETYQFLCLCGNINDCFTDEPQSSGT